MMKAGTGGSAAMGGQVTFGCQDGYTASGPATCQEDGTFTLATCNPSSCDTPFTTTNIKAASTGTFAHGDTFTFQCQTGYAPTQKGVATCTLGTWDSPTCDPLPCSGADFSPEKLKMAVEDTQHGKSVVFECMEGYQATGSAECTKGQWNNAKCEEASCNTAFTTPFILEDVGAGIRHGETATFSCLEGYLPVNPDAECKMGKWDMKSVCEEDPNAKKDGGLSAGVVFVIVMLLLGAAVVPLLMLRNWHAKRTNETDIENQTTGTDGRTY